MTARHRCWTGALSALILTPVLGLVSLTGEAAATPVSPSVEPCGPDGWAKINDGIGEQYSPWLDTAKGLDFQRLIQFRALGGERARECATGREARFDYAGAYRLKSCLKPTACQLTGWIEYGENPGPDPGHRFPDQAVGWDRFYKTFRSWAIGSGPPRG